VTLDLTWDVPLRHRQGSETRLAGVDVYYEFKWRDVFPNWRCQFKNGQCLAERVRDLCPPGKKPALLLTLRDDVKQGFRHTPGLLVFVVNVAEYRLTTGDAALSYIASHLGVEITELDQLQELVSAADPEVIRAFVNSHIDLTNIAVWVADNEERLRQVREIVGVDAPDGTLPNLTDTIKTLEALGGLGADDIAAIAGYFGPDADPEQRIELLRTVTNDPTGRFVTGEVLAERTPQRVEDARNAMADYQALLDDTNSNETTMQKFIESNLWLLGLDYAVMRARKPGISGAMDFILQRYDGFHDLLELKSPHDELIRAPDVSADDQVPSPHEYALSPTLGQALAQALVYRDRLTRYADAAQELYGLPHTRDPRLIIVIGKADSLPDHRQRVLFELNKSLHRVEVVPYDVLAKRSTAVLDNVERYLLAAQEESIPIRLRKVSAR
jgi:hypothetical protein